MVLISRTLSYCPGALFDMTASYHATFLFGGGIIAFSGFLCFPLRFLKRWEERSSEAKAARDIGGQQQGDAEIDGNQETGQETNNGDDNTNHRSEKSKRKLKEIPHCKHPKTEQDSNRETKAAPMDRQLRNTTNLNSQEGAISTEITK